MRFKLFFVLYFITILPHVFETPWWVFVVAAIVSVHAYLALSGRIKKLSHFWSGLFSLVALAIVFYNFRTLLGPEPATALLIILAALKLEEIRTQRDGVIFLYLLILLVMYYLLFSQSILSTVYMVVMSIAITVGFIAANTPSEHFKTILRSSPKLVSKDLLLSLPIFLVLFAFFPRFSVPWASFLAGDKSTIGFSEELEPGQMAQLAQSREPAFHVTFLSQKRPSLNDLYWRGIVLTETDGWRWKTEEKTSINSGGTNRFQLEDVTDSPGTVKYQVQIEPKFQKRLFVLDHTEQIQWTESRFYNPILNDNAGIFKLNIPLVARTQYEGFTNTFHDTNNEVSESTVQKYLSIPPPSNRVSQWLIDIKNENKTPESISTAILNHFANDGFKYSLVTPEMKTVDDFLFNQKIGFCEHFASSYAALMRWAGIPSRIVSGFQGGEFNDFADFLLVRDQHAHSWVEIWVNNEWRRVDPTSSVNAVRIAMGSLEQALPNEIGNLGFDSMRKGLAQIQMAFGALEQKYNQFLLNYNFDAQEKLFQMPFKTSSKKWLLFLGSLLSVIALFYITKQFVKTRKPKDPYKLILDKIHRDLRLFNIDIENHDPISRTLAKAAAQWPAHQEKMREIEEIYLNSRFKKNLLILNKQSQYSTQREIHRRWAKIASEIKNEISATNIVNSLKF